MSISKTEIEITKRFFEAVEILKTQQKIKSLREITTMYGMNYGNVHTMMTKPDTSRIKLELLANICRDFNISAEWLLLGKSPMFIKKNICKL